MIGRKFIEAVLFPRRTLSREKLRKAVTGKTILITGVTYGIGEVLVRQLSDMPVRLLLMARTVEKLQALQKEYGNNETEIICFPVDLYQREQVKQVIVRLKEEGYEPDILIHNAGKSIVRPVEDATDRFHDYTRTMAVNYESPVQLSLAFFACSNP